MKTEQEYAIIFARNLSDEIKRAGMNQDELAEAIGVSSASVSAWCLGKNMPRASRLYQICEVLGCDANYLGGFPSKDRPKMIDAYLDAPHAIQAAVDGLLAPYMMGGQSSSASLA